MYAVTIQSKLPLLIPEPRSPLLIQAPVFSMKWPFRRNLPDMLLLYSTSHLGYVGLYRANLTCMLWPLSLYHSHAATHPLLSSFILHSSLPTFLHILLLPSGVPSLLSLSILQILMSFPSRNLLIPASSPTFGSYLLVAWIHSTMYISFIKFIVYNYT